MQVMGQPASRGMALLGGVALGAMATLPLRHFLPTSAQVREQKEHRRDLESYDDVLATIGSLTFVGATGIAAGVARRSKGTQSVPLLLLDAAGMFTSLAGGTLVKSESRDT